MERRLDSLLGMKDITIKDLYSQFTQLQSFHMYIPELIAL